MLMMPDPATAMIDPFCRSRPLTGLQHCHAHHQGKVFARPAQHRLKAEAYLNSTASATRLLRPRAEFFIFDDVRYETTPNKSFYMVDSIEGAWNTGRDEKPNLGYKPRYKEGYFPTAPADHFMKLRNEMMLTLMECGIPIEAQHHEVATGGQSEIDMKYDRLTHQADKLMLFKYVIKNVANKYGKTVTFMPKPLFGDNGSGMHTHVSIWKGGRTFLPATATLA